MTVYVTRRMRIAYWIPKSKKIHSEYVIIIAFPLQNWFRESVSMLRYMNIASVVIVREVITSCYLTKLTQMKTVKHNRLL
jgi:hypothetical protein